MTNHDQPALVVHGDVATLTVPSDDYALDFRGISLRKHGGLYAEVSARHGETALHTAGFDLLNQRDQELFNQRCLSVNSNVVDWQSRLQAALPGLRELATRQGVQGAPEAARRLRMTSLASIMPERVHFLWKPYLPEGRPVALEGDPGVGKSSLIAKIAAHLTTGQPFPNVIHGQAQQPFPACNVCLLTAEDDPGDTILPRVAVNGGDPARVFLIDGWHQPDGAQGPVTVQDLDLLTQALEQYSPRLLVFDPVQSFFGRRVDMNSASDTRPVLDAVIGLCKQYRCTPLFVRHIGKARRDKALYAGLGSIDITAAMRSVLFLGEDPENEQRRILAQSKANNARLGPSLAYQIVSVDHDLLTPTGDRVTVEAPRLDWDGLSPLTAMDLASPPLTNDEGTSALVQARVFLRKLLAEGPMLVQEVRAEAKKAGMAIRTLHRAKSLENVQARRRPLEGKPSKDWPWEWCFPDDHQDDSPSVSAVGNLGTLENFPTKSSAYDGNSRLPDGNLEAVQQHVENQVLALECLDCQATRTGADAATHCPQGGAHAWIRRSTDEICVRCNATRLLAEVSP